MPITLVQAKTSETANFDTTNLAFDSNVTSGNLLTCSGGGWNGTEITSVTVTSDRSPTFTGLLGTVSGGTPDIPFLNYVIANSSGACTVTIDPNGAGRYASYTIAEWSGIDSTPLDVDGGGNTGGASAASDTITTVNADTVVIGVVTHGAGTSTLTVGSGWTELGEVESGSNCPSSSEYQIFTSAGIKTVDWSVNPPNWSMYCASFKAAPSGLVQVAWVKA